jgi:phosphoribosylanthranilate isomerase
VFVKVCGITNEEDALLAHVLGAAAIGLIFADSPRRVSEQDALYIARRCPPGLATVGVFRNQPLDWVAKVASYCELTGIQLHGEEGPEQVQWLKERFPLVIKAFPAGDPRLEDASSYEAHYVLVDSVSPGSGRVFDWRLVEGVRFSSKLILSGGLNHENVGPAIRRVKPFGVDVCSGVEQAPGKKDPVKMRRFFESVREAEEALGGRGGGGEPFDWAKG